jgi:uncharacterized membrane protein
MQGMHGLTGGMTGSSWIWTIIGLLLIILIVTVIAKLLQK